MPPLKIIEIREIMSTSTINVFNKTGVGRNHLRYGHTQRMQNVCIHLRPCIRQLLSISSAINDGASHLCTMYQGGHQDSWLKWELSLWP